MSEFDSDDLKTTGYFLPEDSQSRLKKLREYVEFLADLARPRTADELQEWTAEIRVREMATCLGLLEEQIGLVLDEISRPAERGERAVAPGADAEPESAQEVPDGAGGRYLFGVTLEQVDKLSRLLDMISAHGDVVIASDDAEFADHTLSLLGDAICDDVRAVRDIICEVELQMLGQARGSQTGVGEERAAYHAGKRGKRGRRKLNTLDLGFGSAGPARVVALTGRPRVFPAMAWKRLLPKARSCCRCGRMAISSSSLTRCWSQAR